MNPQAYELSFTREEKKVDRDDEKRDSRFELQRNNATAGSATVRRYERRTSRVSSLDDISEASIPIGEKTGDKNETWEGTPAQRRRSSLSSMTSLGSDPSNTKYVQKTSDPNQWGNASMGVIHHQKRMITRGIGSEASVRRILGVKEVPKKVQVAVTKNVKLDLLEEAENYLAKSMLIYIYAKLREMATLGYTTSEHRAIDVNSFKRYPPPEDEEDGKKDDDGIDRYLDNTRTAGAIIRTVLEELDAEQREDRESLNHGGNDISIITEFTKWVNDSKVTKPDDAADIAVKEIKRKVARARWKRAINFALVNSKLKLLGLGGKPGARKGDAKKKIEEMKQKAVEEEPKKKEEDTEEEEEKVDDSGIGWFRVQRRKIEKQFGVTDEHNNGNDSSKPKGKKGNTKPNQAMIDESLEKVMHNYFKSGSVLRRMMDQGMEIVYFGDRHPNEAMYCICVNRGTKTVTVIFRGSVTAHNWMHNMKLMMSEQENPLVNEKYEGCADLFGLHTGFGLYMLKKRKDNGQSKIDEIFEKVDAIGRELHPGGRYRVAVTGHSLGGAMSTILSFYAACDRRFTTVAPVRTFTFAAPRVGDERFLNAYKQLERTDRLMHARFANTCDFVPLTPTFAVNGTELGPFYHHVGLQVKLHETNLWGKARLRFAVDTCYPLCNSFSHKVRRACSNNFVTNLTTLKKFGANHGLSEYQRRIHFARHIRLGLGQTELRNDKRRKELKSLEEYYRIRAHIPAPARPVLDEDTLASRRSITGVIAEDIYSKSSKRRLAALSAFFFLVLLLGSAVLLLSFSPEGAMVLESFTDMVEIKREYYLKRASELLGYPLGKDSFDLADEHDGDILQTSVVTDSNLVDSEQKNKIGEEEANPSDNLSSDESNVADDIRDADDTEKYEDGDLQSLSSVEEQPEVGKSMDDVTKENNVEQDIEKDPDSQALNDERKKEDVEQDNEVDSENVNQVLVPAEQEESEHLPAGNTYDHLEEINATVLSLLQGGQLEIPSLTKQICDGLDTENKEEEVGSGQDELSYGKPLWGLARSEKKDYDEMTKSLAGLRARYLTQEVEWKARYFAKTRLSSFNDNPNVASDDNFDVEIFKNEPGTVLGPLALHILRRFVPLGD